MSKGSKGLVVQRRMFAAGALLEIVAAFVELAGHQGFVAVIDAVAAVVFMFSVLLVTFRIRLAAQAAARAAAVAARPRMTAADWAELREMEAALGWEELSEPPPGFLPEKRLSSAVERGAAAGRCECGFCDGTHEGPGMRWFRDTRGGPGGSGQVHITYFPYGGEPPATAPMTGPGGRWQPLSELPEVKAVLAAAAHFEALAAVGRKSCLSPCEMCDERWTEDGRWIG
jgi:hypothetical protein